MMSKLCGVVRGGACWRVVSGLKLGIMEHGKLGSIHLEVWWVGKHGKHGIWSHVARDMGHMGRAIAMIAQRTF